MPNQVLKEMNRIRQFKLNKVHVGNLTRKLDRDMSERFIRASFPLSVVTLLKHVTVMREIRVRKKRITRLFKRDNVLCVLSLKWFNFMIFFPHSMLKRFNKVQFMK